jgi:hypothetical protein
MIGETSKKSAKVAKKAAAKKLSAHYAFRFGGQTRVSAPAQIGLSSLS